MAKIQNDEIIEETKAEETVTLSQAKFDSLLQRMEELEKNQSDATKNKFEKSHQHYDGPLQAKYRMWSGVPVLGFKSVKKDNAYELYYKSPTGQRVDNHFLELRLSNGETLEGKDKVLNASFANFYERSELMDIGVLLKDGTELKTITPKKLSALQDEIANFVFYTKDHGKLIVDRDCIN